MEFFQSNVSMQGKRLGNRCNIRESECNGNAIGKDYMNLHRKKE
jgi:hypothetical protein